MNQKDKQIFEQCVKSGLYTEFVTPPRRPARWEVIDLAGNIRGVGEDPQTAIDAAWDKFRQEGRKG